MSDSFRAAVERSAATEARIRTHPREFRMLTGDRPTGALHIGHYFGSIANRLKLQESGADVWQIIADYQVITDREIAGDIRGSVRELVLDSLAAGIDPERTTMFTHSAVPALNQLLLPFLSLVSVAELQRNPTVKDEAASAGITAINGLMLTYPVHQAADILFCKGNVVPVGRDQLPHIEQTRVVARRFNERYGATFPEPVALLSEVTALLGTDGTKMSKSRGNVIELRMTADETAKKIKGAKTDSDRTITWDPEHRPEVANLLLITAMCEGGDPASVAEEIGDGGGGGLKARVTEAVNTYFAPMRARREELAGEPSFVAEVLARGNERANEVAETTLDEVREKMGMTYGVIPTLTDGAVTLRAHTEDDVERIVEQSTDPASIAWTVVPVPYTRDDAKRFVRHAMPGGWETDQEWAFAVEHEGEFAGTVSLRNRDSRRAEIAYGSHPQARGRGVMARALRLLLAWGFTSETEGGRGLDTVLWLANRGNWASRRLAWSVGFSFDGTVRSWLDHRGEMVDAWAGTLRRGEELSPNRPWLESPTIRGDAVVLRELTERDLPRIVETLNDPETQRWHERPREQAPHTLETQAGFVLVRHEQAAAGTGLHWAVADPDSDAYLGQMSLFSIQHRRQASLSYWTHPDARGRGLTKQAARLVVRHCFVPWEDGGLGMRRLWSDAELDNGASRRVLESVGFVQTGLDRSSEPRGDGTWADQARYDLLANEFAPTD